MDESIFIESNENRGILFDGYKDYIDSIYKFIISFKAVISKEEDKSQLDKLDKVFKELKKKIKTDLKPKMVSNNDIEEYEKKIKDANKFLYKSLYNLSSIKKELINKNNSTFNSYVDTIEKYLLDLFNLVDQDLNILTLLKVIYVRNNINESTNIRQMFFENLNDEFSTVYNLTEEEETEEQIEDLNEDPIKDRSKVKDPKKAIEEEKNGTNRKRLYIAFIQFAKRKDSRNLFSSIFDTNAFDETFSFIPESIRYFYRMANPIICVIDDLIFFSLNEIKKANENNNQKSKYLILAHSPTYEICIDLDNEKMYKGVIKNNNLIIHEMLDKSFDLWLQGLIGNTDFLNWK